MAALAITGTLTATSLQRPVRWQALPGWSRAGHSAAEPSKLGHLEALVISRF